MSPAELRERLEALQQDVATAGHEHPYDVRQALSQAVATAREAEHRQACDHAPTEPQLITTPRGRFVFTTCTRCFAPLDFAEA